MNGTPENAMNPTSRPDARLSVPGGSRVAACENSRRALLVRAGGRICALGVSSVVETLRMLPIQAVAGVPEAVRGLSIIRGVATPIVDLAALLGGSGATPAARLVLMRVGERPVALAVEAVLGMREVSGWADVPPLLQAASLSGIEALATLDSEFVYALDAARLISDEIWNSIAGAMI